MTGESGETGLNSPTLRALAVRLDATQLPYEFLPNAAPLRSAAEGAAYFGIHIRQTAPALVVCSGTNFYVIVLSGARGKVDFSSLAPLFGERSLRLAKPDEVEKVTGCKPGAIPLVGMNLPCIADDELYTCDRIYGGSGDPGWTLRIDPRILDAANTLVSRFRL